MKSFLGVDVGSVTTKLVVLDNSGSIICYDYRPTQGNPSESLTQGLKNLSKQIPAEAKICGCAATGSARRLAAEITGADIIKNEITCQAIAAISNHPDVQTVIEIGGQDSKIIIIKDGMVADFGMNTICAAGTGSFLDHQARRLNMNIEEFSQLAQKSQNPVIITGRCTVFAESAMISKQQEGANSADIAYGLCQALVRNYLGDVGLGREIKSPVVFQGGVAFNGGMVRAFEEKLNRRPIIPAHPELTGAIGAARLAAEEMTNKKTGTNFRGFATGETTSRRKILTTKQRGN